MSFTKDVTITFFSRIAMFVIGISNSILIARVLGPEGKGVIAIVFLLPSMIAAMGSLGIGAAHIFFMGQRKFSKIDLQGFLGLSRDDFQFVLKFGRDVIDFLYGRKTPSFFEPLMTE